MMDRLLVVKQDGTLPITGSHNGRPLVTTVGPSGHLESWPLQDILAAVQADGAQVYVIRNGVAPPQASQQQTVASMRRALDAARAAGKEEGINAERARQMAMTFALPASAGEVALVGYSEEPAPPMVARILSVMSAGVISAVVTFALVLGWFTGLDASAIARCEGLITVLYFGHLGVSAWIQARRRFAHWVPVTGGDGYTLRRTSGGQVEVLASKGGRQDWRKIEDFAAVAYE